MVLTIHHLGHSQSDRVVFLCEELSIPYTLEIHHRSPLLAPPSMKSLHPLGSSPIITDTDTDTDATSPTNPLILAETQACFEYIIHRHGSGRFYPRPDAPHYADFLFYYHVVNGTLQPTVLRLMTLSVSGVPVSSPLHASTRAKLDVVFGLLDTQVGRHTWLAGEEFTAADMMVVFSLTTMREFYPVDLSAYGNLLAYLRRLVDRPAYRRYLAKADPDIEIEKFIQGPSPPLFPALAQMQAQAQAASEEK